ncbi:DciA family protein [Actinomyces sp.]|uniref:DUF721 domain-containing protein n=1 Tax=Actinomyces sp. TaxID=29317 RepID=UPI0028969349|nr:DciA family protein [Actinomyces sp.]
MPEEDLPVEPTGPAQGPGRGRGRGSGAPARGPAAGSEDGDGAGTSAPRVPGLPEPTPEELSEVALGVLARFQEAARSRGDLRRSPRRSGGAWRREGVDEGGGGPAGGGAAGAGSRTEDGAGDPGARGGVIGAVGPGTTRPVAGDARGGADAEGTASTRWRRSPGLAASRTRWPEPRALGSVIGRMSKRRGWDGPTAMGSVMAKWPDIVGEQVAEHCHIETFEGERLVVRCSSTAWTKQLRLLLPHIERRIEEEVGPGVVTQVIVRGPAAPSWKRGRLSVPGRGPRDTYG